MKPYQQIFVNLGSTPKKLRRMRFVDVKNDIAFRKIFGNEKKTSILLSFLNAVLQLEGKNRIEEVQIINPYLLPRVAGEKASIIDIKAKDGKGQHFIIEMQVADADGFDKRVQYYTCKDYAQQINRGEEYKLLKPTYFIGILDFNFFEGKNYLSHHIIVDGETYEHKLKDIQFTFIELKKFNKAAEELENLVEKWIFFIKNAENLKVIPEHVEDPGLEEAYNDAELFNWDKEALRAYDNAFIALQDARGRITAAERKGMAKGMEQGMAKCMEQGIEQGKLEEKKKSIQKLYSIGMTVEEIADFVELSVEQVQTIIHQLNL